MQGKEKKNYVNNVKHGNGSYKWNNGKTYSGNWVNNRPEGNGVLEYANKKYDVLFRYGKIISAKLLN